jgi:uncharacterized membrane protein
MRTRLTSLILFGIILWALCVSAYLYPFLPVHFVTHWDTQGVADGTMHKNLGLFLLPVLALFLSLLFSFLPSIDPHGANIEKFRKYYNGFVILLIAFLIYLHFLTILWNLGVDFAIVSFILVGIGILFYYIGILFKHAHQNWFIGIRTPWTLSSVEVWKKTHHVGGVLFSIFGILSFLGAFLNVPHKFLAFIILLVAIAIFLVFYSYVLYRQEKK